MIVVTGGAGFIGSNLVAALNARGIDDIVVCDSLGGGDKWRNIARRELCEIVAPEALFDYLARHRTDGGRWGKIEAVFHLGANSSTDETDADLILRQNVEFSLGLWRLCAEHRLRLIYASSAATYGDGGGGFDDEPTPAALARLRPLNLYGWSKHVVDRRVVRWAADPERRPAQWAGLKFFNAYGPNEYHKGPMQSVIAQKFAAAQADQAVTLYKSYHADYADGGQMRDFIHVRDCVAVMLWLYDSPGVNGLFNVGTGQARSFADLVKAMFAALGRPARINYIDMPEALRAQYQYYTQARTERLRAAGYHSPFTGLEDGVRDYVQNYLTRAERHL